MDASPKEHGNYQSSDHVDLPRLSEAEEGGVQDGDYVNMEEPSGPSDSKVESSMKPSKGLEAPGWFSALSNSSNWALFGSFFCWGVNRWLLLNPLQTYALVELGDEEGADKVLFANQWPFAFIIVLSVISDCLPFQGQRRKPWLIGGWCLVALSNVFLGTMTPSMRLSVGCSTLQSMGLVLVHVGQVGLLVELSQGESLAARGTLLVVSYMFRCAGTVVGTGLGDSLYISYDKSWSLSIRGIVWINMMFPLALVLPFLSNIEDCSERVNRMLSVHVADLYNTLQRTTVWQTVAFFMLVQLLQVPDFEWIEYLHLSESKVYSTICLLVGMFVYRHYLFDMHWDTLFQRIIVAVATMSVVFLAAHFFGVPVWGWIGGMIYVIDALQVAMDVILVSLCPVGMEATAFVFLTQLTRVPSAWTTIVMTMWPYTVTLICVALLTFTPLMLLTLLPESKEDQQVALQDVQQHPAQAQALVAAWVVGFLTTFGFQNLIQLPF